MKHLNKFTKHILLYLHLNLSASFSMYPDEWIYFQYKSSFVIPVILCVLIQSTLYHYLWFRLDLSLKFQMNQNIFINVMFFCVQFLRKEAWLTYWLINSIQESIQQGDQFANVIWTIAHKKSLRVWTPARSYRRLMNKELVTIY